MKPEMRKDLTIARQQHYYDIIKTAIFALIGVAAIIQFGPDGYSAPLTMIVIATVAHGIIAGNAALTDVQSLISDMDDELRQTSYGKGVQSRNMAPLKMISTALLGLTGIAELYAIFF